MINQFLILSRSSQSHLPAGSNGINLRFGGFILSTLLFLCRLLPTPKLSSEYADAVQLYQGTIWHERRRPVHHSFRYSVKYALIDLDRSAGHGHLTKEARVFEGTTGSVLLLTIPVSVGYEQNPLSVYYCYDGRRS